MSFDPCKNLVIDAEPGHFLIQCPFWANELLNEIPSRRWSKAKKRWQVAVIGQNVEAVKKLAALQGVKVTDAAADAFEKYGHMQFTRLQDRGIEFPRWYKFKVQPLKHQWPALDKGYGLREFALHMEMQTGKSKVAIDLATVHRIEGNADAVLVIAKRTLRRNWLEQLQIHCPIPWSAYLPETSDGRGLGRWLELKHDFKWMIVGWESLSQGGMPALVDRFLAINNRLVIIGDETTYISNYRAGRTEHAVRFAQDGSKYRYALAGKPALEGPMNLFSQYQFLNPEIIGLDDFFAFRNRYAVMGGFMKELRPGKKIPTEIVGYQNQEELHKLIAPHTFQFLKKDGYDLPPKRPETRTVQMSREQRALYDQIRRERQIELKGHPTHVIKNVLEQSLRLQQVAGGYSVHAREVRYIGRDKDGNSIPKVKTVYDPVPLIEPKNNPKMKEVCEYIEEFRGSKQALLWAAFMPEIVALVKLVRGMGLRVGELHGNVPDPARQPMVNEFQRGGLDIIIGNAATGGMGFTMMAAEVNMYYNNTFKAIDRVQSEDRPYGIGQTKSVIVCDFLCEKSIDVTALAAMKDKMDLSDYFHHRMSELNRLLDGEV